MSKLKKTAVIFALITSIILGVLGNFTVKAQEPDTGKYTLNLEYTDDHQGQPINKLSIAAASRTSVTVDISGSRTSLENPYISIRGPKAFIKSLGVADIPSKSSYTSSLVEEGDNTCLQITFAKLQGGDKFSFFVTGKYQEYFTPDNQQVPLEAELFDAKGKSLVKSQALTYTIEVNKPTFTKSVDKNEQEAGEDDNGYVKSGTEQAIPFKFNFGGKEFGTDIDRAITAGEITDTLPTYTDKNGQLQVAEVDTAKSKGWEVSADKKTAVYKFEKPWGQLYGFTSYYSIKVAPLYLKFPLAKLNTAVSNKATYKLIPSSKQAGENDYTGESLCQVTLIPVAAQKEVNITLYKYAGKDQVQDTTAEKAKEQTWTVRYEADQELKNVSLLEEPDKRLYITEIKDKGYPTKIVPAITKVEGRLADGSWKTAEKESSGFFLFGDDNTYKIKDASKYQALRISFKKLPPNLQQFGNDAPILQIKTKFREPDKIKAEADDTANIYKNTVKIKDKSVEASFKLQAFSAPFGFSLTSEKAGQSVSNGEEIKAEIKFANTVPEQDKTKKRKIVVIIPDGLTYTGYDLWSAEIYPYANKILKKEIIPDYHASGKTALVYTLNDCAKTNLVDDQEAKISMRFAVKDLYRRQSLELRAYYSFEGVETAELTNLPSALFNNNAEKVADKYDINDNGKKDDLVATCAVTFNPQLTRGLWARTLVGRTEDGLSPDSIALQANEPTILALCLNNSLRTAQKGLVMYATLPHKDDKTIMPNQAGVYSPRGSSTDLHLTGAVKTPVGYDVYYLTENPPEKAEEALALSSWTKNVTDWSQVKAFKLVAQAQTELAVNSELLVTAPVQAAQAEANDVAVASFAYKVEQQPNLVEANNVRLIMPKEYTLKKIWQGAEWYNKVKAGYTGAADLPAVKIQIKEANTAEKKVMQTVTLSAQNKWEQKVQLPAYIGAEAAKYTFAEEKPTEPGFADSTTTINVKPTEVEIVNTLNIKASISKTFTKEKDTLKMDEYPGATLILQKAHTGKDDWQEYKRYVVAAGQEKFRQEETLPIADKDGELTYKLTETAAKEGWECQGGQLQLDKTTPFKANLALTNTWKKKAAPVQYEIKGHKLLKANKDQAQLPEITGKYQFKLAGEAGAPLPDNLQAENQADGSIKFSPITFKYEDLAGAQSKTFTYTVTESGTVKDVQNDAENEKSFALTLSLKADGNLQVEATADASAKATVQPGLFCFTNVYQVKAPEPTPSAKKPTVKPTNKPTSGPTQAPVPEKEDSLPHSDQHKPIVAKTGESKAATKLLALFLFGTAGALLSKKNEVRK